MQYVNFERVEDAQRAFEDKNSRVVPMLTGVQQLKMRFKPVKVRAHAETTLSSVLSA